ncbi:Pyrrolidone-carboxylate peptidase [Alkalibacterium sp. AK22]|uniref:pyroglutamyl-peptidase I n=1 Tax=Alkalibacterium sp. AK22 TaxID=1229520 RepID=UPI00044DAF92|nr:pyroglutamyl-peptidase I [Alkalibacterium sp. AK22]EXJ22723.1 Pyrrolidone-carboxylate peptidase [Alkalibacterium sp. AK22]
MKILLAGFDPFNKESVNPAWEAVKSMPDTIEKVAIEKVEIPTVFHQSAAVLLDKMAETAYDAIICVGQAGGRSSLTPERVAINLDDARIADNQGNQPIDQPIQSGGPAAYFSTLPVKAIVAEIRQCGLPSSVSNSAGTFVCNHIMYQLLHAAAQTERNISAGFIHVPFIPEQVTQKPNQPSMNLEDMTRGLEAAVKAVIDRHGKADLKEIGGSLH